MRENKYEVRIQLILIELPHHQMKGVYSSILIIRLYYLYHLILSIFTLRIRPY